MSNEVTSHGQSSSFLHLDRIWKLKTDVGPRGRGTLGGPDTGRRCRNEVNPHKPDEYQFPGAATIPALVFISHGYFHSTMATFTLAHCQNRSSILTCNRNRR